MMARFPNMPAGVLAILAAVGLAAAAIMVATADREGEGEVTQSGDAPAPAGPPAPAAPAQIADDVHIGESPDSAIDIPILTETQANEVKIILNSDERLNLVLSGESFTVTNMGAWVNGGELVGALAMIRLDNPVSYTGFLPGVGIPANAKSGEDYIAGEVWAQAEGIESLETLVDLNRRVAAAIRIEKATGEVRLEYGDPRNPIMGYAHMIRRFTRNMVGGE